MPEGSEKARSNVVQTMFIQRDPAKAIADLKSENRGLFDEIKKFVDKWVSKLKAFYSDKTISQEGEMVAQLESFEKIQKLFMEAMDDAGKNFDAAEVTNEKSTTQEGDAKLSNRKEAVQGDITNIYQKTVDQVLNMQNTKPDHVVIGYTPQIYEDLGMPSLPFVIGTGHIYSAAKSESEAKLDGNYHKGIHYHGLGASVVKNIYEKLEDPVMIIASKDLGNNKSPMRSTHSVVAIVDIGNKQKSLLLPVEITAERTVDGVRMDVNALSSIYEKGVDNLVNEAIALENIGDVGIYYAKKEALTLPGAGVQFPVLLQQSIASSSIIHRFPEKVNMNISDATQSQQFKRWFGDWQNDPQNASKVVNSDGTPKVMYHGTNYDFTVFDKRKAKAGAFGKGFYFSPSRNIAGMYGTKNNLGVYLNIQNPYVVTDSIGFTAEEYRKIQQELNIKERITDANVHKILAQNGYDGIMVYAQNGQLREAVVFDSNQIKSATDNIGTFDSQNKDINYSLRNEEADNSPRGILMRMDVKSRKLDAEKYHLRVYQERVEKLAEQEARLKEANAKIEELSSDKAKNKATIGKLQSEARSARLQINMYNQQLREAEQTSMIRKLVSDGRLLEYRAEQREAEKARIEEYRALRKEITGMFS